jgi:predicted metalloprotease with PDZ domain
MAAALRGTAEVDWQGFYERYIRGHDPLPLDNVFHDAGLKLGETANGLPW